MNTVKKSKQEAILQPQAILLWQKIRRWSKTRLFISVTNAEHVPQADDTVYPAEYALVTLRTLLMTKMEDKNKVLYTRISYPILIQSTVLV